MGTRYLQWEKSLAAIQDRHPKFELVQKKHNTFSKIIAKILFWTRYMYFWTTIYPKLYAPAVELDAQVRPSTLQHEWVHLEDFATMFGLLKFMPWWFNSTIFGLLYLFPLPLVLLAFLAFVNPWWLLALVFALPLPAPFRMIAEMRAYRRSKELGGDVDRIIGHFTGSTYYFMWPFKKHLRKLLEKPSPYREIMDEAWEI